MTDNTNNPSTTTTEGVSRAPENKDTKKKSNTFIIVLVVTIILLLLCCCCSAIFGLSFTEAVLKETSTVVQDEMKKELEESPDSIFDDFGQTVEQWNINVSATEDPYLATGAEGSYLSPDERMVAVELDIKNTANYAQYFPKYMLTITDDLGRTYYPTSLVLKEPSITVDAISAGNSVSGWVVFIVSKDSEGLVLSYDGTIEGQQLEFEL